MYRSNTCGELRLADAGKTVTLAGWVQKARKLGGMTFIDLRDRYGITQLVTEEDPGVGREWVIQVTGQVVERQSKNPKMPTGDIEVKIEKVNILNKAQTPPFTIEEVSDGGEDLRAKYRYLDLRRAPSRGHSHCVTVLHRKSVHTSTDRASWRSRLLISSSPLPRVPATSWFLHE